MNVIAVKDIAVGSPSAIGFADLIRYGYRVIGPKFCCEFPKIGDKFTVGRA